MSVGLSEMSPDAIPQLSTMMASAKVANAASTMMLKKTMDITEQGAASLINMMRSSMERSVNPSVGGNVDITV